ncbi:hypothetical protein FKP32DRAFT_1072732 [Trametes sanguinea]|nr:hypothetical protein FKP32DRAFT_1072732 [Trametes sanguinea]
MHDQWRKRHAAQHIETSKRRRRCTVPLSLARMKMRAVFGHTQSHRQDHSRGFTHWNYRSQNHCYHPTTQQQQATFSPKMLSLART